MIETRKDQIAAQSYAVRARARADAPDASKSIDAVSSFLARPDRRHSFADWLRMLVEEMLVIDAATILSALRPRRRASIRSTSSTAQRSSP